MVVAGDDWMNNSSSTTNNNHEAKTTKIAKTTENLVQELNSTLNGYKSIINEIERCCEQVGLVDDSTSILRGIVKLGDRFLTDEERLRKGKVVPKTAVTPQLECIPKMKHREQTDGATPRAPHLPRLDPSKANEMLHESKVSGSGHKSSPSGEAKLQFRDDYNLHGFSSPPRKLNTSGIDLVNAETGPNSPSLPLSIPDRNCNSDIVKQALSILYSDISRCRLAIKQIWIIAKGQLAMMSNFNSDHCKPPIVWNLDEDCTSTPRTPIRLATPLNDILARPGLQTNPEDILGVKRRALLLEVEPKSRTPLSGVQPYGSPVDPGLSSSNRTSRPNEDVCDSFKRIAVVIGSNDASMRWNAMQKTRVYQGIKQSQSNRSLRRWHKALLTPRPDDYSTLSQLNSNNPNHQLASMSYDSLSDGGLYSMESSRDSFLSSWNGSNMKEGMEAHYYEQQPIMKIPSKIRPGIMNLNRPTNRRSKSNAPVDYDAVDPATIGHDIWMTGESVDAPTADIYIKIWRGSYAT